ncbi:MAG: LytTR family transcriptional regulator [Bacteroidales bacterium]|nr:LytTR family transcriptional regulator [Bacteroidales bacterium]
MKRRNTIATILLNILPCTALLWFFSRNAYLRPYLGSTAKEVFSGLLLLATLYANYLVFYQRLYRGRTSLYWFSVVAACLVAGCIELAVGYPFISQSQAFRINEVGMFNYFFKFLFLVFSRNLAFNFFPYLLAERKQLQQSLETEIRVVYQQARMIDVCDGDNNCQHILLDDIFYCKKNGNETQIYTVDGVKYTRYCSLKYLMQLLDNKEFVRISSSFVVPVQHIVLCDGEAVVMKAVPWMEKPLTFDLDIQKYPHAPAAIEEYLRASQEVLNDKRLDGKVEKGKKHLSVPPKKKLDVVLSYISEHPGCRSTELISHTSYPKTTMDRCLYELKKRGKIQYSGSKKFGGYHIVNTPTTEKEEENSIRL